MNMNAIILAAGRGSRMRESGGVDYDIPKCLLSLGKETILGRQVRLLNKVGITNITVVVAYKKELIMKTFPDLKFIKSKYEDEKGRVSSMYSLFQTKELWGDTIILLGDAVFSKEALDGILTTPMDENGFLFFGSNLFCRKGEGIAVILNMLGSTYLRNLQEPFYTRLHSEKPIYYRDTGTVACLSWWASLKFDKDYQLVPVGFSMDVDKIADLEFAKAFAKWREMEGEEQ